MNNEFENNFSHETEKKPMSPTEHLNNVSGKETAKPHSEEIPPMDTVVPTKTVHMPVDPTVTAGTVNPAFTQRTVHSTVSMGSVNPTPAQPTIPMGSANPTPVQPTMPAGTVNPAFTQRPVGHAAPTGTVNPAFMHGAANPTMTAGAVPPSGEYSGSAPFSETRGPAFKVTYTEKKKKRPWLRLIAMSLVAGILFGSTFGASSWLLSKLLPKKSTQSKPLETTNIVPYDETSDIAGKSQVARIAQECMPSVVAITNYGVSEIVTFFGTFEQESTSSGSGIIIDYTEEEILIVTNYHVVANTRELSVLFSPVEKKLENKETASEVTDEDIPNATVKGYDPHKDIAVIAVKRDDIPDDVFSQIKKVREGDSSIVKPGDQVVAIGNALGYGQSVTTGIISAVNRNVTMESSDGSTEVTNSFIQTDAAINSGNSGGALLDMEGRLIGINSVKMSSVGVEGMGYAIPISDVKGIIDDLMLRETRELVDPEKQGFLGINGSDVDSSDHDAFGMPIGVYVSSVVEGLAAEKAGIKVGNIITKFDGYTITTIKQLQDRLKYYAEGEKVSVTVMVSSGDKYTEKEITVTLSNRSKNVEE